MPGVGWLKITSATSTRHTCISRGRHQGGLRRHLLSDRPALGERVGDLTEGGLNRLLPSAPNAAGGIFYIPFCRHAGRPPPNSFDFHKDPAS
jgi:hypothetical protein